MTDFEFGGLRIRRATERDARLVLEWRNHPEVRKWFETTDAITLDRHLAWWRTRPSDDRIFIAETGGVPVATASLIQSTRDSVTLGRVMVDPGYQGQGIGMRLTLALTHVAFQERCGTVDLAVKRENARARALYARAGFTRVDAQGEMELFECRATPRDWEQWDTGTATDQITRFWQDSGEQAHRTQLAKLILAESPKIIFEVGCGNGLLALALEREGFDLKHYVGIDTSRAMLAKAVERLPKVRFRIGDIFELTGNKADTVVCCEVLGHLPELAGPLENLCRAAERKLCLSLWIGEREELTKEQWDATFLHHVYTEAQLGAALAGRTWSIRHRAGHGTFVVVDP